MAACVDGEPVPKAGSKPGGLTGVLGVTDALTAFWFKIVSIAIAVFPV